ncbi:MAG: DegT/DnrJ/EryC1/StrS family aminotransferase [Hydrococcus sp. Prado102]|nr:DegT/DnrJ/EryC1/StrS family aminotransferase [Hydrococcus sp. Prado102]
MKQIPPVDLARQHQLIRKEIEAATLEVLNSGRYIGGAIVSDFEKQFANYVGVAECVACNSGTDALYLTLRALNIGRGDEVITTPFTFFATAEIISRVGAKPVFVDIDPKTFNLDVKLVEAAITSQTKAMIPVHLFGQPVDMTRLCAMAHKYNLIVIEDCAQATGAQWADKTVGNIGQVGCFSFFPTKNLGACGDGGAVTTNDPAIAKSIRLLKEHGMSDRYLHEAIGLNSRLDTIQAAILQVKLRHLDSWNQQRAELAAVYDRLLQPLPDIELPQVLAGGKHVWNQYTIRILDRKVETRPYRDRVREKLQDLGVASMVYYPIPLHLQPVYKDLGYKIGQLPQADRAAREVLSLPLFPALSFEEQQQVVYALKDSLTT